MYRIQTIDINEIKEQQDKLNKLYDDFTAKYGLINSRGNNMAFSSDSSYFLLCSLEVLNDNGELERKADMFTKRTIGAKKEITHVDTASEALAVSLGEKARIDMEFMSQLTGKTENELFEELKGVIFLNPLYDENRATLEKYLTADEYLSGNVREKLEWAKRSAELYPNDYTVNVDALTAVQPKDLTAAEITVRLGTTWIPPEYIKEFTFELLTPSYFARRQIDVHYSKLTGNWNVSGKSSDRGNVKINSTYGTHRINALKIIEDTLNLRDVRIFDYKENEKGKPLCILQIKEKDIHKFNQEAKKYGVLFTAVTDKTNNTGLCDVIAKQDDVTKLNYIMEKLGYTSLEVSQEKAEESTEKESGKPVKKSQPRTRENRSEKRYTTRGDDCNMKKPSVKDKVRNIKSQQKSKLHTGKERTSRQRSR